MDEDLVAWQRWISRKEIYSAKILRTKNEKSKKNTAQLITTFINNKKVCALSDWPRNVFAWEYVNICGVKMFCSSRANHTSTNFKKFLSWKLNTSRVCITVSNSPNPSSVYIRLCKHRKKVFYCLNIAFLENTVTLPFTSNLFVKVKFHSAWANVPNLRELALRHLLTFFLPKCGAYLRPGPGAPVRTLLHLGLFVTFRPSPTPTFVRTKTNRQEPATRSASQRKNLPVLSGRLNCSPIDVF